MRLKILSPFLNNDFMKLISSLEGNTPKQGNHQGNKNAYWRLLGYPRKACGKVMLYTDHIFKCDLLNLKRLLSDCGRSEYEIVRILRPHSFLCTED